MFVVGLVLNSIYVVVEASVGLAINSLPLLSDASHNLGDVLCLFVAWIGHALAHSSPTTQRTYGYRSATILAALFNGLVLIAVAGGIFWEAIHRFGNPPPEQTAIVVGTATLGIVINTITALMFMSGHGEDLNIRGAFLHMAADAAVSVGVVVSALLTLVVQWYWLESGISMVIALLIIWNSWGLVTESFWLSLHAVPNGIDVVEISKAIKADEAVDSIHDVHVWAMSTTETALTAHVVCPNLQDQDDFLIRWSHRLRDEFKIVHATIQIESGSNNTRCLLQDHCEPKTI